MGKRKSWKKYEKQKARQHRGTHLGGPRKPDYKRGKIRGEVKHWKNKLTKPQVRKLVARGIREIVNKSGFTGPAIEFIKKRWKGKVKLYHRNRRVA